MSLPRLRPAEADDLLGLMVLESRAFVGDRLSRRSWRHLLKSRSARVLVAEHAGSVVGAAVLLLRQGARTARLYSLARLPAPELRGLGQRLLIEVEGMATAAGAERFRLEVRCDNTDALRLYERSGYRTVARLPGYYADGGDGWRMEKPLVRTECR